MLDPYQAPGSRKPGSMPNPGRRRAGGKMFECVWSLRLTVRGFGFGGLEFGVLDFMIAGLV